jgi:hypothetical protein
MGYRPFGQKTHDGKVDKDILSFTVPFKMFQEMEGNVEGSSLRKRPRASVIGVKEGIDYYVSAINGSFFNTHRIIQQYC